jgi:hypothetical protein
VEGLKYELRKFSHSEKFLWRRKNIRNQKTALELEINKSNIHAEGSMPVSNSIK